ncbi:amino acid permease [bacterium]|nr:amino acid permease [bacterium]
MGLKKELSLPEVFSIAAGAMISSGLFVLPGLAYAKSGPAMILAYLLASVLILPSLFAKAELATAMPKSGGTYFYIERSLGPVFGTFGGLANWFSLSLKSAFALVGIGAFAVFIKPDITVSEIKIIAVAACILFTITNIVSVKVTGRVQVILVFLLISILILYIGRGFISTHPDNYLPFMPKGLWSVVSTAGLVFVSFGGLTKIASIAEEVKNPSKNIPLGMMLAFFIVSFLYALSVGVTVGIVNGSELNGSLIPLSLGAGNIMGKAGAVLLAGAAIMAFITTANSGILTASRSPLAMSKDKLMPDFLSRLHPKFNTPYISILITSGFMVMVIIFLSIENLVKTASTLMIVLFSLVNLSVIIMRESKIQNYRPQFKVPLYPVTPVLALIFYVFLLFEMGMLPLLSAAGFFIIGWISYLLYSKNRVKRISAIMHIVERVTDRELKTKTLEEELKQIVIGRDEIIEDRFDKIIKNCKVLDLDKRTGIDEVFKKLSEILAPRVSVDKDILYSLFIEREKQSCTVIKPGLAIPHVIIPGQNQFDIVLVRSKKGIIFPGKDEPVKTMFILVGTIDGRNFHLRALMSIAQIVQEPGFEKRWMDARSSDELKDVILLSKRKRDA